MTPAFDSLPKRIQDAISALEIAVLNWEEMHTIPQCETRGILEGTPASPRKPRHTYSNAAMKVPFYFSDLPARAALFRACTVLIDQQHFVCSALMDIYRRGNLNARDFLTAEAYVQDCLKNAGTVGERLLMDDYTLENWTGHCHEYRRQWCWNISRKLDGEPYETEFDTEKVY